MFSTQVVSTLPAGFPPSLCKTFLFQGTVSFPWRKGSLQSREAAFGAWTGLGGKGPQSSSASTHPAWPWTLPSLPTPLGQHILPKGTEKLKHFLKDFQTHICTTLSGLPTQETKSYLRSGFYEYDFIA